MTFASGSSSFSFRSKWTFSGTCGSVTPGAQLWGGRFSGTVDPEIHRFTASLPFDRRLAPADLVGSLAHARMLWEAGILAEADPARPPIILVGGSLYLAGAVLAANGTPPV